MTTRNQRTPYLRTSHDGEVFCKHRDISCCPECFARTPGLVDVASQIYWHNTGDFGPADEATADPLLTFSPGTDV